MNYGMGAFPHFTRTGNDEHQISPIRVATREGIFHHVTVEFQRKTTPLFTKSNCSAPNKKGTALQVRHFGEQR